MNRREVLKSIAALGITVTLPGSLFSCTLPSDKSQFIGLGTAGAKIIEYFHQKGVAGKYMYIDKFNFLNPGSDISFIQFNRPILNDYDEFIKQIKRIDVSLPADVQQTFMQQIEHNEKLILIAGLSGYTGTYLVIQLANLLKQCKTNFTVLVTTPFNFEGIKRKQIAQSTLEHFQDLYKVLFYNLENIRTENKNLNLHDAFEKGNKNVYDLYLSSLY